MKKTLNRKQFMRIMKRISTAKAKEEKVFGTKVSAIGYARTLYSVFNGGKTENNESIFDYAIPSTRRVYRELIKELAEYELPDMLVAPEIHHFINV